MTKRKKVTLILIEYYYFKNQVAKLCFNVATKVLFGLKYAGYEEIIFLCPLEVEISMDVWKFQISS